MTDGERLALHMHTIAWWDADDPNVLYVTFCGYPTRTTKERINGVFELLELGRPFYTKDYQLYFGCELRPVDPRETIRINIETARRCRADNQTIAA